MIGISALLGEQRARRRSTNPTSQDCRHGLGGGDRHHLEEIPHGFGRFHRAASAVRIATLLADRAELPSTFLVGLVLATLSVLFFWFDLYPVPLIRLLQTMQRGVIE
jgi:hypothetical protein